MEIFSSKYPGSVNVTSVCSGCVCYIHFLGGRVFFTCTRFHFEDFIMDHRAVISMAFVISLDLIGNWN